MPTNIIPFAGIPAPQQFISALPHFPNAGMGQRETHVNHLRQRSSLLSVPHSFVATPRWPGTVVGIDLNIEQGIEFAELLEQIRKAYFIDVKRKKDYSRKI